ncbi:MAG: LPXTG cell wall anchor domain-containing protein, partial [Oscillospiraceae bacterium]|nr:LPXTG cell wall anchor domain-containing protein [Oscillospiraceae bacterium]
VSKIAVVLHENFGEDTTTSAPKVSAVSGSPATGDKGSSTAVIAFIAAGCTAFALRRKNEK